MQLPWRLCWKGVYAFAAVLSVLQDSVQLLFLAAGQHSRAHSCSSSAAVGGKGCVARQLLGITLGWGLLLGPQLVLVLALTACI